MSLAITFAEPATVNTAGAFLAAGAVKDTGHDLWVYLGFRSPTSVSSCQTSPDRSTWTMRAMPSSSTWRQIAYSSTLGTGGRLVAVGNGVAAYSDDGGITWAAAVSLPEANNWIDVTWWEAKSIFVMVASSGVSRVGTSADGKSWTMVVAAAASAWSGIAVSPTVAVAVTNSSVASTQQVMTSSDGATWTMQTHASIKTDKGTVSSATRHGIGYSPTLDMFLITGTDGGGATKAYRSINGGVTWTASSVMPTAIGDTTNRGYVWVSGPDTWYCSAANFTYGQSANGVTWTVRTLPTTHAGYTPVGWDSATGVLLGGSTLGFDTVLTGTVAGGGSDSASDPIELPPVPYRSPAVQPGIADVGPPAGGGGTLHVDYIRWLNELKTAVENPSAIAASDIVGGFPLSKNDDTNVTITLAGTPSAALLASVSLTMGWTGTLSATRGGTGFGSYAVGDLLYANTTSTLAKLADVAVGSYLRSGGVSTAPLWSTLVLPNAANSGDILKASGANTYASVAPAALTKVDDTNVTLTLGGTPASALVNAASITLGWTGLLAVPRGGTGANTFATNGVLFGAAAAAIQALAVNATATKMFLSQSNSNPPAWSDVAGTDLTGTTLASNIVTSSLTSVGTLTSLTTSSTITINANSNTTFDNVLANNASVGNAAVSRFRAVVDGGSSSMEAFSVAYVGTGMRQANAGIVSFSGSAGGGIAATNAAGELRMYTGGNALANLRGTWKSDAGLKIESGTSASSTNVLENRVGVLYFNGSQLALTTSIIGTTGTLAKFVSASTVGDSLVTESGTTVTVGGLLAVTSDVAVNTNKFTVTASSGNTLVAGTLNVTSDFKINTTKFTVTASSGNTLAAGTLDVTSDFKVNTNKFTVTASSGDTLIAGALTLTGKATTYNNVATEGWGVPAIYKIGRLTAQSAAISSVAAYTVGAADGSFRVSCNVNVTSSTTHSFSVQVTYTDEGNTSRTLTLNVSQLAGTLITTITNTTGVGPYEGVPVQIRCKASTSITIKTTGTFTSLLYNVEGSIIQIS